jgi:hypothetical protein
MEGTGVAAEGGCHAIFSSPRDLKMKARAITRTIKATTPNKLPRELKILLIATPPCMSIILDGGKRSGKRGTPFFYHTTILGGWQVANLRFATW